MSITDKIKEFSSSYSIEVNKRHSAELKSFKLLVNEIPLLLNEITKKFGLNFTIKGSIGAGVNTYFPWLGIFDKRVSSGATKGFYVAILFSNDFKDVYLTLNQGSTIQSQEKIESNRNFIYEIKTNIDGFIKGKIPSGGLVKINTGKSNNNGKKYEETNIFYRKYEINNIDENDFVLHLNSIIKTYVDCVDKFVSSKNELPGLFNISDFQIDASNSGLFLSPTVVSRFIFSLLTKPFVILTGLSGSGKTKLAQAFAMWISENDKQYCIVPVGADWTNREPLLGFPNALEKNNYKPDDYGVLNLIINATKNPMKPHFLILDEMNLSHVERYFADFLSVMESENKISLHSGGGDWNGIPPEIEIPPNLFIVGTVNIDETTYMFSPKVLDRSNVIEFRISYLEMKEYLEGIKVIDLENLKHKGANMSSGFINIANDRIVESKDKSDINIELMKFFSELRKTGAEFGYRSASEILRFAVIINKIDPMWEVSDIIDVAIMQKLLPKVHGSKRKLEPILKVLASLCLQEGQKLEDFLNSGGDINFSEDVNIKYPISLEKILRMLDNLRSNAFTSYAEA